MTKYAYNNVVHTTTSLTPFKALIGYNSDFDVKLSRELKDALQDIQRFIKKLDTF